MGKISIRQFQREYREILKNLPVELTLDGETVAYVVSDVTNAPDVTKKPKVTSPLPPVASPFILCKQHKVYKITCGCK